MNRTAGRREIVVALLDGPVDMRNSRLATGAVREMAMQPGTQTNGCSYPQGISCRHGTFVAGILAARRGSGPPAICPECSLLVRPIFAEDSRPDSIPSTTPGELASAVTDVVEQGARIVNLSCQILPGSSGAKQSLNDALDHAAGRGTICIAAAGNDGFLTSSILTRHPWVIPVAACDATGRPLESSNLGHSIGRRGLLAPGEGFTSLDAENGESFSLGGTSAAAPFVTGAAALLWSEFPQASATDIRQAITRSGVARRNTVVPPLLDAWGAYESLCSRFGRALS